MIEIIVYVFLKKLNRRCIDNVWWQIDPVINDSNRKKLLLLTSL